LPYVIVRASLVYGREVGKRDSKLVRKFARLAVAHRAIPVVGGGESRVQPVYIADLVDCLQAALFAGERGGEIWEVGGPEVMTFREFAQRLSAAVGGDGAVKNVPYPVAFAAGLAARVLKKESKVNLEQVKMTRFDNVCKDNTAVRIIGDRLKRFEDGMARTVARFGAPAVAGVD
jgi:NADH dehydrogenase